MAATDRYIPAHTPDGGIRYALLGDAPETRNVNAPTQESPLPASAPVYTSQQHQLLSDTLHLEMFGRSPRSRLFATTSVSGRRLSPVEQVHYASQSPLSPASQDLLTRALLPKPRSELSVISVYDAPDINDDFYTNNLAWSTTGYIALGIANTVYLAKTSSVSTNFVEVQADSLVTSVAWSPCGEHLAFGTERGDVHVVSHGAGKITKTVAVGTTGVASLAWHGKHLIAGSRWAGRVTALDLRAGAPTSRWSDGASAAVCALVVSPDGRKLAVGTNNGSLAVLSAPDLRLFGSFRRHNDSAVKAVAWSPRSADTLLTGGGIDEATVQLWNVSTGATYGKCQTSGQVTGVAWSPCGTEFVTSHGFPSFALELHSARTSTLELLESKRHHSQRALSLAAEPFGRRVATLGGDEQLVMWNAFCISEERRRRPTVLGVGGNLR